MLDYATLKNLWRDFKDKHEFDTVLRKISFVNKIQLRETLNIS